jgi:hypothetical protein
MARWRTLGRVLGFGAIYDGVFGLAILAATKPVAAFFGLAVPDDPLYLGLNGVFLLILAGIYGIAAFDPERFGPIAPVASAGRVAGFALFARAWALGGPTALLGLGLVDLAIGVVTFAAWRRANALSH